jgi:hypothetical protein
MGIERVQGNGFAFYRTEEPEHLMLTTSASDLPPTVEIANAYQAIFDYFNDTLFYVIFGERLPRCVLNLSRKRGAAAFFSPGSWIDPISKEHFDEISLVPEWTGREPREVLSTLVHEMAHQKDHLDGTSAKNGYHSQTWAKIMARLGLPERPLSKSRVKVTHDIDPDGPYAKAFENMPRDLVLPFVTSTPMHTTFVQKKDTKQGMRAKYVCPACGAILRGRSGLRVACEDCDETLHELGW